MGSEMCIRDSRDTNRRCAFEIHGINAVGLTAELNAAHILEPHQATGISGSENDVLELLGAGQTSLQLHREGVFLAFRGRGAADLAGGHQTVLASQLVDHIGGREVVGGQLLGVQPKAEGDLAVAEVSDIADCLLYTSPSPRDS